MWTRIKQYFGFWTEGIDESKVIRRQMDEVDAAETALLESSAFGNGLSEATAALRHVAGVQKDPSLRGSARSWRRYVRKLTRRPSYRLAAARILAQRNQWDLETLRLYRQTGYQKLLLPHNPLFAFVEPGIVEPFSGGLAAGLNVSDLQLWLRDAWQSNRDDLVTALQWSEDKRVASEESELFYAWTRVLVQALGPVTLMELLKLMKDQGVAHRPLRRTIEYYAKRNIVVTKEGTLIIGDLFPEELFIGQAGGTPVSTD